MRSIEFSVSTKSFFVNAALNERRTRWRNIFLLAYYGNGMSVDVSSLPDDVLEWFIEWNNEAVAKDEESRKA